MEESIYFYPAIDNGNKDKFLQYIKRTLIIPLASAEFYVTELSNFYPIVIGRDNGGRCSYMLERIMNTTIGMVNGYQYFEYFRHKKVMWENNLTFNLY